MVMPGDSVNMEGGADRPGGVGAGFEVCDPRRWPDGRRRRDHRDQSSSVPMAKKGSKPIITLECTECSERNYTTEKNRTNDPGRIELMKYCIAGTELVITLHRETK